MSRDLNLVIKGFADEFKKSADEFKRLYGDEYKIIVTCTYRSPEEQNKLYKKGRTEPGNIVTNCDGYNKRSQHNFNPSRAIDITFKNLETGQLVWYPKPYELFYKIFKKNWPNLNWGGKWKHFKDYPHYQIF